MIPAAALLFAAGLALGGTEALEQDASQRLSVAWNRAAVSLITSPSQPEAPCFHAALEVALAAAELAPNDAEAWRCVQTMAELDGESDAAAAALARAVKELNRLDPDDPFVQLARLSGAAERGTTADDRVAAYQKLLQPGTRERIAAPVAARLAFDLALLEKRRGKPDAWSKWLREAVAIDPSFPMAAETLAGFEAGRGAPAAEVAAALVTAVTADPGSVANANALARVCLQEGLYDEAQRLLELAVKTASLDLDQLLVDDLLADRALALWLDGRRDDAMAVLEERQAEVNAALRRKLGDSTASRTQKDENAGPRVTLPVSLTTVRAAIGRSMNSPKADEMVKEAVRGLDDQRQAEGMDKDPAATAAIDLRKAWVLATLGDASEVPALLESVERVSPLTPAAKARFDGWLKLRQEKFEDAVAVLQPVAAEDASARVGLGMALAALGRKKEAATAFVSVVRQNRDNLVGAWAADRLQELVKMRVPAPPESGAVREAVARMPGGVLALAKEQAQALNCSVTFGNPATCLDPIPLTIRVQNRTSLPLEITPDGPVESRAAVLLDVLVIGGKPAPLPPWICPLDRRMRLMPGETLDFTMDMARTALGQVVLQDAVKGVIVEARMITNFRLTSERVQAGFMGNIATSTVLRIPSVKVNAGWREDALGEIREPDQPKDLPKLVMLAYDLAGRAEAGEKDLESSWAAVNEAWKKLPPVSQAWALMALPRGRAVELAPLLEAARLSTDERVRLSYLLGWVESPDDTQLAAATRTGGRLGRAADGVRAMLQAIARDAADVNQRSDDLGVLRGAGSEAPKSP